MDRSFTGSFMAGFTESIDRGARQARARRRFARPLIGIGIVLAVAIGAQAHAAAKDPGTGRLYRYKNEDGRVEIANAVPADRVSAGYEVLDVHGQVLETVGPELTPEQLREKEARDRAEDDCRQNIERVTALYGSMQDIDTAEREAQRSLEVRIANLEASQNIERRRLEEHEAEAAQRERTGRTVTPDLEQSIERSRAQIRSIDVEIAQRRQEQVSAKSQYAAERRYFETGECDAGIAQTGR